MKLFNSILVYLYCLCIAFIPINLLGANDNEKDNPWNQFYARNVDAAIEIAGNIFAKSTQSNEKIDIALAWIQFCKYYSDAYCMEEPFKYLNELASTDNQSLDDQTRAWLKTELQNSMVSLFASCDES